MGNSNSNIVLTDEVNLNHFRLLRVVGKGAFGKVRIVERKDTGLTFALKYIRKDEVVRSESVRNIIRERRMLEHLNHPFLCNLRYSFQDMEYLYIVVDLMNGGDLRFHISRKTFTEEAVRFWIAQLGCALRYIHKQGIVHRDVKPDNVLLDSEGHVHLADFNVASDLTPGKPLTSKSGTLAYLAPEVYTGRGYYSEPDWWSLGVLFYECIYNKRPFEANHHDALAQSIVKADPPFPVTSPPVSMPCLHAISSLLEKNKNLRIGAAGWETFTDNPFFREIDFEALEAKEIEPVFCPSSEKTNFDATYDLEELLLEEAPLEARARKQKPRAELRDDATQQEIRADELHRMIETMFEPFNYTIAPNDRSPVPTAVASGASKSRTTKSERSSPVAPNYSRPHTAHARSIPNSRSQTPGSANTSGHSARGSPPLPTLDFQTGPTSSPHQDPAQGSRNQPRTQAVRNDQMPNVPTHKAPNATRSQHPRGSTRSTSMGGGVQVVLNEEGSWSDMANQSQGMVAPSDEQRRSERPSGMLGFLSRKKGRDRSPKGKEKERGVIGKEGARVIISHG
ncbi:probable ribosomal protein S6 kinase 2 beta [Ramularia collo-cygni]|uniref:Probable ribosomal protein S6 kinase 2 beta n=1 Tax=Ramularia collo-cygni TaxID=112498 RepID=A0A2D3ULV5_9PEZI|nr:probable ribosomal protein S6 kinase 2 beta [Ramularia collo-cygni]CZT15582.1 probable ribosomal protein S6 kinase 2 beta [Ramularia collo-cygni]